MKPNWKAIGIQLVILFVIFKIWSAYPVQDMVARFHGFINPKAYQFFDPLTARLPSWLLVRIMDDGNFNLAESSKVALGSRGDTVKRYFDRVKLMTTNSRKEVRVRAYSVLQSLDKERAIKFYFEELDRLPKDSSEYRQCLGILNNYKPSQLLPYLLEYGSRPEGWKNASCVYLEEYGDPAGLPVLYDQKKQAETEEAAGNWQGKMELKRIDKAIATLEAIKTQQENQIG